MPSHRLTAASELLGQSVATSGKVAGLFPFKLSRFLSDRLAAGTYSLSAARQFLPDGRELIDVATAAFDPCNEASYKVADQVIQRYQNRAALVATHHCLVYCRFCFRRDFVGFKASRITDDALESGLRYLESNSANRDVLVTGGDPLALPNRQLIPLLERLSAIPHLQVIRVHSRALSVQPDRIDDELLECFRNSGKIWFYTHMNHPDDIDDPEVLGAAARLRLAGVPILNQAVVLGGVNDDPAVVTELCLKCYEAKILPYHLYVLDHVPGASHFRVGAEKLLEIFDALGDLPGPAQPVFVVIDDTDLKHRVVPSRAVDRDVLRSMLDAKIDGGGVREVRTDVGS
jgi:KamA family protein